MLFLFRDKLVFFNLGESVMLELEMLKDDKIGRKFKGGNCRLFLVFSLLVVKLVLGWEVVIIN